jgi:hypothetical protein
MRTQPMCHIVLDSSATERHHGHVETLDSTILPPAFEGRHSSEIRVLSPGEVRKMRGFERKVWRACLVPPLVVLAWGCGAIFLAVIPLIGWLVLVFVTIGCYLACKEPIIEVMNIWSLSKSGTIRQAKCPNCGLLINFWKDALDCPTCKHRLIQHGNRLYEVA